MDTAVQETKDRQRASFQRIITDVNNLITEIELSKEKRVPVFDIGVVAIGSFVTLFASLYFIFMFNHFGPQYRSRRHGHW